MEFDKSLVHGVGCDRINIRSEKVNEDEFALILSGCERLAVENKIVDYDYYQDMASCNYRHNIKIKTTLESHGAGGVYIAWQHNSAKKSLTNSYDMKIEFNPSKIGNIRTFEKGVLVESEEYIADKFVYQLLGPILDMKINRVIEFDIAIDLKVSINELVTISNKGRYMDLFKGTRYFGTKHKDYYLKVYDKTRERKEKANQDTGTVLTRLEYSLRPNNGNGITYANLKNYMIEFDKFYTVALYNEKNLTDNMISNILCLLNGIRQMKDFHKDNKKKILTAIKENLAVVPVNEITNHFWSDILAPIKEWTFDSSNDENIDDFMKRLIYNNNEQWEKFISRYE